MKLCYQLRLKMMLFFQKKLSGFPRAANARHSESYRKQLAENDAEFRVCLLP